jgi:hypothetical protein
MRRFRCTTNLLLLLAGFSLVAQGQSIKCEKDLKVGISLAHPDAGSDFTYARSFAVEDALRSALLNELTDACIIQSGEFDKEQNFPALKGSLTVSLSGTVSERNPDISAVAVTINRVDQVWGRGAHIILAFPLLIESRNDFLPSAKTLAEMIRNYGKHGGSGGGKHTR